MESSHIAAKKIIVSYQSTFRFIFVLFFLYLLEDVFFRWDGFRHFASFSEFLPSVALICILWTIVAALTALLALILIKSIESISSTLGKKIKAEHQLIFGSLLVLILALVWRGKRMLFNTVLPIQIKIVILFCVILAAILFSWLIRSKFSMIQEKLSPLVMLFGIIVVVSFPIVTYHTLIKKPQISVLPQTFQLVAEDKPHPNILLVTFDAMTTLDMSAYGYQRDTTPFIKKWAKNASLFTRAYSASTTTSTTTATLMTGKRLWTHLRFTQIHGGKLPRSNIENLAVELKKSGLYTMSIATNGNASVTWMGIADSFDYHIPWAKLYTPTNVAEYIEKSLYYLFGKKIRLYEWLVMEDFVLHRILSAIPLSESERPFPTETTISKFMEAIDNKAQEPFFAWIHFHPPHAPYTPPALFKRVYDKSSNLIDKKDQRKLILGGTLNKIEDLTTKRKLIKILRDRYDENMLYSDKAFENLIGELKKREKLKNSVIILSSDHGESFDHDYYGHGGTLYESSTHIPLIIRNYKDPKGQIIETIVGQEDIPATVLGLAELPVPSWMDGRSLVPLMQGKELPPKPVFSMNLYKNTSGDVITAGAFAIWEGDYKLINTRNNNSYLFNLKLDPGELNNLIDVKPKVATHLQKLIDQHLREANKKIQLEIEKTAVQ